MAARVSSRFLLRHLLRHHFTSASEIITAPKSHPFEQTVLSSHRSPSFTHHNHQFLRFLSTRSPRAARSKPDVGARARQMQTRRLWTYAITFSCIAGFIVIVLNQFQDQLVFYITPTDALQKYNSDPTKSKFRLGGLVLENSYIQVPDSPESQFVITDLITDILVKYDGSLPDLFREGHSAVVEGSSKFGVTEKARSLDCYFAATEVLAKHDEKYMPAEVAAAIEKNKKLLEEKEKNSEEALANAGSSSSPPVAKA
ncbi:cytochrome c-type biogenesis protein ccmE [Striga asiatica]|uniref:Cytochrome c-type biogenesis protein ccmE n=1 Tax=Striga asiatica TaxID=4170 RepID=A0A5A7QK38_STRAF|nr:cytochrome c-type biogenesis protein ccmE [Striga asiatica]